MNYQQLKAWLKSYVAGDPRIPDEGWVWGEDKRLLDRQAGAKMVYPYFWVSDAVYRTTVAQDGLQMWRTWELSISIKQNSPRDAITAQEAALGDTWKIADDFLAWLTAQAAGSVHGLDFDPDQVTMTAGEAEEIAGNWGWDLSVTLRFYAGCWKYAPAPGTYTVATLLPVAGEGPTLALEVNGEAFSTPWTGDTEAALLRLVKQISSTPAAAAVANTDGVYLYLRSAAVGGALILDPTSNNDHAWSQFADTLGRTASGSSSTPIVVGDHTHPIADIEGLAAQLSGIDVSLAAQGASITALQSTVSAQAATITALQATVATLSAANLAISSIAGLQDALDNKVGSEVGTLSLWVGTPAEYSAIGSPSPTTIYWTT